MYCKHCLKMIPDGTIICPNCGKSQKNEKNKKIIIFSVILAAVVLITGFLIKPDKKKYELPLDTVVQDVKGVIERSGFQCEISYDETGITADAIYPNFAYYANEAIKNGGEDLIGWNDLVDSVLGMADGIDEFINEFYGDIPFNLFVFNDQNPDNLLIMIVGGEVVYDVVNSAA